MGYVIACVVCMESERCMVGGGWWGVLTLIFNFSQPAIAAKVTQAVYRTVMDNHRTHVRKQAYEELDDSY